MSSEELVLRVGGQTVRVQVHVEEPTNVGSHASASASVSVQPDNEENEGELVPATGPAPLHLLSRSTLGTVGGSPPITPEDRIRRAYQFGQRDSQAALDGEIQLPNDQFPLSSRYYVVLYQPSGDWPKVLGNLREFYKVVKEQRGDRSPDRQSAWKPGIYSRGFPSKVEVEAYLWGASCRYPNERSQS